MKTGHIVQAKMLRIEPEGLVLETIPQGETIWAMPDLKEPFLAGRQLPLFVSHRDSEGRFWGSIKLPSLVLGDVEFLPVHAISRAGVFFDWGMERPLFCPLHLVLGSLRPGMMAAVRLVEDDRSDRLMGNMLWKKQVLPAYEDYSRGRQVEVLVMEPHELGFLVLVDQWYQGIIYANQVFKPIRTGDRLSAFVNALRPDGKLDILLRRPGYREVENAYPELVEKLKAAGGRLNLGDKSPADLIYSELGMSKKVFKKAIGALYREGRIGLTDQAIWLQEGDGD